jgi:hypothetical protein
MEPTEPAEPTKKPTEPIEPLGPPNQFRWVRVLIDAWKRFLNTRIGGLLAILVVVVGAIASVEKPVREGVCHYYGNGKLAFCSESKNVVSAPPSPAPSPTVPPTTPDATPEPASTPAPAEAECDEACRRKKIQEFVATYDSRRRAGLTVEQERVEDGKLLMTFPEEMVTVNCPEATSSFGPTTVEVKGDTISVRTLAPPDAAGERQARTCTARRTDLESAPRLFETKHCSANLGKRETPYITGYGLSCKTGACWVCTSDRENPQRDANALLAFDGEVDGMNWARAFVRWTSEDGSDFQFCLGRTAMRGNTICSSLSREQAEDWREYQAKK